MRGLGYGPGGAAAPVLVLTQSALQRQPRSLTAVQPLQFLQPRCPNSQLQPSECSAPAHSTPQPPPRSHNLDALTRETATRGGMQLGLCLRGAAHASRAAHQTSVSTEASLTSALLSFGAEHTLEGNRLLRPDPQDFCCGRWGAHPSPDGPGRATAQRKFTAHTAQVSRPPTPATLPIKATVASTP